MQDISYKISYQNRFLYIYIYILNYHNVVHMTIHPREHQHDVDLIMIDDRRVSLINLSKELNGG